MTTVETSNQRQYDGEQAWPVVTAPLNEHPKYGQWGFDASYAGQKFEVCVEEAACIEGARPRTIDDLFLSLTNRWDTWIYRVGPEEDEYGPVREDWGSADGGPIMDCYWPGKEEALTGAVAHIKREMSSGNPRVLKFISATATSIHTI